MNDVVVGIDHSETAARAAAVAAEMAQALGVNLHLVTCADKSKSVSLKVGSDQFHGDWLTEADQFLKDAARGLPCDQITHAVGSGDPANFLCDEARRLGAKTLVVGNRRVQGMSRVLGSVAGDVFKTRRLRRADREHHQLTGSSWCQTPHDVHTPVSIGVAGGPFGDQRAQMPSEASGREPLPVTRRLVDVVEVPPTQFVQPFSPQLFPTQRRRRLEAFRRLDHVVPITLAIPLPVQVRSDVLAIPDVGADDGIVQPDLFDQFAMQRLEMGFARVEAAARQRPHRGVGELEPHQQDVLVGGDEQGANCLSDTEFGHRVAISRRVCRAGHR